MKWSRSLALALSALALSIIALERAGAAPPDAAQGAVQESPPGAAQSDPKTLEQLRARLAPVQLLRGEFTQEKRVTGFQNPLRSKGRFVLARDKGVIWTTLSPFPSELVLTRERILSIEDNGSVQVQADAKEQPAVAQINATMFALVDGDIAQLSKRFQAAAQLLPQSGWTLTLTPREAVVRKVFSRIELRGDAFVRSVLIVEASGDATALKFSALTQEPPALRSDEAKRLE